ncbi:helix-turn-helix transcriptional regulator [Tichowtungia aerotolerans]|uniref:Uncharacterized protein n=1 Tax=Tichowtungia aerotolerans TaxID=2697043 RepID=A0A6P1M1T3_9BACT|nr:hypothetical protein [Tichowtungia aerotolerans]QHI68779.1 hypothetical protein GT409_04715 [Tichowtungia aerotolerans]
MANQNVMEMVHHLNWASVHTKNGRGHAKIVITALCEELGVDDVSKKMVLRLLLAEGAPRRITTAEARRKLGISRTTFHRWVESNRFGLGEMELIRVNPTRTEMYVEDFLEVMRQRNEKGRKHNSEEDDA